MPLIDQGELFPGDGNHSGAGDITQSFFFLSQERGRDLSGASGRRSCGRLRPMPSSAPARGASDPPVVALMQSGGWTVGALANHIWSYAGESKRPNVSSTFLQPFITHTWPDSTGLTLNSETTYDWIAR
jgi:hypothetical protein